VDYLVVRLADDGTIDQWAVFDGDGRVVRRMERGADGAAEAARGRRVIVLVPGVDVVNTTATLPNASAARLRKMLPYSLEDALAEDIDDLFFAVGPRLESGAVSVAIVAHARLEEWLAALSTEDIVANAVYSDAEGVPDTPSTLTLVIEEDRIYGRAPDQPAFVFEGLGLTEVVGSLMGTSDGAEPRHAIVYVDEGARQRHDEELRSLAESMSSLDVKLMTDGALHRFAATVINRPAPNLLQGPYAPKSNWESLLRPWRAAASLLVGLLLLMLLAQTAELVALRQEDRALTETLSRSCAESFAAQQLGACETAVRARLSQSGMLDDASGNGFLTALAAIAESRAPSSRIEAMSFRNRVMDLQVVVPDVPALDAFAQQIEGSGSFNVAIQSANPGESGVEGRVQLVGATR
jgi:general secretion pathway protein L